jgi:hypothetical protein
MQELSESHMTLNILLQQLESDTISVRETYILR